MNKEEFKTLTEPFKIKKPELSDVQIKKFDESFQKAVKYQQLNELDNATKVFQNWLTNLPQ